MAMAELVADLAPEIQEHGYELIQRADNRLRFETRSRPRGVRRAGRLTA
jgi:hypothetical protein